MAAAERGRLPAGEGLTPPFTSPRSGGREPQDSGNLPQPARPTVSAATPPAASPTSRPGAVRRRNPRADRRKLPDSVRISGRTGICCNREGCVRRSGAIISP
jgi:hypothetical protein